MTSSLNGSYTARFDASGRFKIPEKFRETIEAVFGKELFITSLSDESIQIYPLSVWEEMVGIASEGALHLRPDVRKFMLRVNRKGSTHEIDPKGRVLISPVLRRRPGSGTRSRSSASPTISRSGTRITWTGLSTKNP